MRRHTSSPSRRGSPMSSTMRSIPPARAASSVPGPSAATPTSYPSRRSARASGSEMAGSSSASRTLVMHRSYGGPQVFPARYTRQGHVAPSAMPGDLDRCHAMSPPGEAAMRVPGTLNWPPRSHRPRPSAGELGDVDRVGHGLVASVVGMQMVAAVVRGVELQRVGRVRHGGGEVEDAVVGTAGEDPVVDGLPDGLSGAGVVAGALEGQDGSPVDLHAGGVRLLDEGLVAVDEVLGGQCAVWPDVGTDGVDAFQQDDILDAGPP